MNDPASHKDLAGRVSPAEFSRRLGVSKPAVSKAIRVGRIRLDEDGLLDPVQAELDWLANTRPKAQGPAGKGRHASGYAHARARKETALARMAELRIEQAQGVLAPRADFDYVLADLAETLRGLLENLPDRLVPLLQAAPNATAMHEIIRAAADEVLGNLADLMARRAAELDEAA